MCACHYVYQCVVITVIVMLKVEGATHVPRLTMLLGIPDGVLKAGSRRLAISTDLSRNSWKRRRGEGRGRREGKIKHLACSFEKTTTRVVAKATELNGFR